MKLSDRIREWVGMGDADKMQLDRRAFLKGMAVTSAGLLVPGAAVFDMGRAMSPVDGNFNAFDLEAQRRAIDEFMQKPEVIGNLQIAGSSQHFMVGDLIEIGGTGIDNDVKHYVVSQVADGALSVIGADR